MIPVTRLLQRFYRELRRGHGYIRNMGDMGAWGLRNFKEVLSITVQGVASQVSSQGLLFFPRCVAAGFKYE